MADDRVPTRLNRRHIEEHARRAIFRRLGYDCPDALIAVERDGDAVVVRCNSGGNELAVESALRLRGYSAKYSGPNPGGYGCAARISLRKQAPRG